MPKILSFGTYSADGTKGLLKEGGSKRRAAVEQLVTSVGGTVEEFYFSTSGDVDFVLIADIPDTTTFLATGLTAKSSGALHLTRSITLVTPEEMDAAAKKIVAYRAPGQP